MQTQIMKIATVLAALAAAPVYADCVMPNPPKIPDGATATLDEMKGAQQSMREYNDLIKAYTDCLGLEATKEMTAAKNAKVSDEERKKLENAQAQKNNSAVDQATEVTARFNEQVRIYKARASKG